MILAGLKANYFSLRKVRLLIGEIPDIRTAKNKILYLYYFV